MKLDEITLEWQTGADTHNFEAAKDYLSLFLGANEAERAIISLRYAELTNRRANDILRACRREALPIDDPGVREALFHVIRGEKLPPPLVLSYGAKADICDGYHRVCLAYQLNPFMDMPVLLADLPGGLKR